MNKAFVREQDAPDDRCPRCGAIGVPVRLATLSSHLPPDALGDISNNACFCPTGNCEVGYFDHFDRIVLTDRLLHPVYPKDPDAPICPCFGFTCDDIDEDLREDSVDRVRAHRVKAESSDACCETASADGRSCIAAVQRYYMQRRNARSQP